MTRGHAATPWSAPTPGAPGLEVAPLAALLGSEQTAGQMLATFAPALRHAMSARAVAVLRVRTGRAADVLAIDPSLPSELATPAWLQRAAELSPRALTDDRPGPEPVGSPAARTTLVLAPCARAPRPQPDAGADAERAPLVLAALLDAGASPEAALQWLALGGAILTLRDDRERARAGAGAPAHLTGAVALVAVVMDEPSARGAAMALCNHVASAWDCRRVALGARRGPTVRLLAMSHTERLARTSSLGLALEAAMEECLDQDVEVASPAPPTSIDVTRQHAQLLENHGSGWACSFPLRLQGQPRAVLTVERDRGRPMSLGEVQGLRLAADLLAPRLIELDARDRWFGARAAAWFGRLGEALVGPRHTWAKLLGGAAIAGALALGLVRAEDRVAAPFVVQAIAQRAVVAPYDGYLDRINARAGDAASAGQTVLGALATADLALELAEAAAREAGAEREASVARSKGDAAGAIIAEAGRDEARARVELLRARIEGSRLVAPLSGVVVGAPGQDRLGAAVRAGELLFEVAQLDALRVELSVPDHRASRLAVGQIVALASAARPGDRFSGSIEAISPAAEVVGGRSIFRVRVRLEGAPTWLRPGMEGLAKVGVGRASVGELWTRDLVDWLRLTLWL